MRPLYALPTHLLEDPRRVSDRCRGDLSIGAEIRAHLPQGGEQRANAAPQVSCKLRENSSLHAPTIGHGDDECPGQMLPNSRQIPPKTFQREST